MLQLFRRKTLRPEADYGALFQYMPKPIVFISSASGVVLDETDGWLKHLITPNLQIKDGIEKIFASYSNLAGGERALRSREDSLLSEYDGMVNTVDHAVDYANGEDTYISVSKLELFGRCPLQIFYQEVLGVRAKEVAVYDRTRWLDAMKQRFHEFSFMVTLKDPASGQDSLVKGVVDYLFEEEDGWVLVDFKTDTFEAEHEQEFIDYTERGLLLLFLKTENIGGCAIFSFLESQFRPSFSILQAAGNGLRTNVGADFWVQGERVWVVFCEWG